MGLTISRLLDLFASKENVRMLMLGLDGAGKTTILFKLKLGEVICTIPTIGFNVETVQYKNLNFTVWDIGGQKTIRTLWHHYYTNTSAIIFVVDSSDLERIPTVKEELHDILHHYDLRNTVLAVLANKQDLPNALSASELAKQLDLASLRQVWRITACSAVRDQGIFEALENVREMLKQNKKQSEFS